MTLSSLRPCLLFRGLTPRMLCISVRGVHQHTNCAAVTSPHLQHSLLELSTQYNIQTQDARSLPFQYSLDQPLYSELFEQHKCLGGLNISTVVGDVKPNLKYKCPKGSDDHIEKSAPSLIGAVLPLVEPLTNQTVKISPENSSVEKLANPDLVRIRTRKMKLHRRKKRMQALWPLLKRLRMQKNQKKEKRFQNKLNSLRTDAENFDAFKEIKANLEYAKLKGYRYNIFNDKTNTYGFAGALKKNK